MRVFALGDLHLPSLRNKPMDRFGWLGHPGPLGEAWDASVASDDLVLLVGDLSWATRAPEATPDFDWIEARPGKKVLVKGNHDHWWGDSYNKLTSFLSSYPSVVGALHDKRAFRFGRVVIAGTRGWTAPEAPSVLVERLPSAELAVPAPLGTAKSRRQLFDGPSRPASGEMGAELFRADLVEREAKRLAASIDAARALEAELPDAVKIAAMHFPPLYVNGRDTVFSKQIEAWGPTVCVYGHLHGPGISQGFVGEHGGVPYRLVSCDAARFEPVQIMEV